MNQGGQRTVVLGFDALSMTYLDEFDLPAFDALREQGVSAPLRSTFPPWTGSAWPSMYTGVDPSHHGVYSFFDFSKGYPDEATLVDRNDVRAPALWNYLTDAGVDSIALNVPVTHPADEIDGVLVPGYLAPEEAAGYPEGIRDELSEAIGEGYRIYATKETGDADAAMLESYVDLVDHRRLAAQSLLESRDPTVAFFVVQKTDTVFHQFDDLAAFRRVYDAADRFVGAVLDSVEDDVNVVVCSDHGMGPTRGYNVYVNEILREAGFVEATHDGETPTLWENKRQLTSGGSDESPTVGNRAVSGVARALASVGVQPGDVYAAARRVGADSTLRRLFPDVGESVAQHVDWAASKAYCRNGPELGVRINLQGREPEGVVSRDEYESVRDRIVETLSGARTPDGGPVFDWVRRRESVYGGPFTDDACDILFEPAGMNHLVATNLLGKRFVPIDKHNHKREGVFIGAGPGFEADTSVDRLGLTDVAPIVMALAGQDVPERMTGSIPSGLLAVPSEIEPYGTIAYGGETTATDDGAVEARLEDLGYL